MHKDIFEKYYDGESIYDVGRDIEEAFSSSFNPSMKNIPRDEHGFQLGRFKVKVEWTNKEGG